MEKSSLLSALADNTLVNIIERNRCITENIEYPHEEMIHKNLQKLETGIKELDRELSIAEESGTLSSKNLKGKEDALIKLKNQYENLETLIHDKNDNLISNRKSLFERDNNKPQTSTSNQTIIKTDDLDNAQVLQLQERIITDQNLDRLDAAIERQRELGLMIGEELDYHIELLADTEDMVDNTDGRLNRAKRSLVKFSKESKKKGSACAVILLMLILFLILIILHS
ncbi:11898_t:CDS:2 [Diversispora eburnea]|uniref:11898_t:CDS:1 n=1 Tax=Diversispora eburnea TaxID=1213867 RepID=A0A9N9A8H1_9GLOM|nr:11898_t:CDS:2 [Diversispora eburnea]